MEVGRVSLILWLLSPPFAFWKRTRQLLGGVCCFCLLLNCFHCLEVASLNLNSAHRLGLSYRSGCLVSGLLSPTCSAFQVLLASLICLPSRLGIQAVSSSWIALLLNSPWCLLEGWWFKPVISQLWLRPAHFSWEGFLTLSLQEEHLNLASAWKLRSLR